MILSKAKVNPIGGQSTPRTELDGAVLTDLGNNLLGILQDDPSGKSGWITPFNDFFGNLLNDIGDAMVFIKE